MPALSVIIVSYNTRETTLRCLGALFDDLADRDAEVFVVDNASTDHSAEAIEAAYASVKLIRSDQNLGFAGANNLAIRVATGSRLLLLNSDAFLKPGAIVALNSYLDAHEKTAAVGPRLLNTDGSLQRSCFKFPGPARSIFDFLMMTAVMPNHPLIGDYRAWAHDQDRTVDFVTGACMLIRRAAIDSVGLFDESFFFYFEEVDWCMRASRLGWQIGFTSSAEVIHEGGASGKTEADRVFNQFQTGHARFIRKHYGRTAAGLDRIVLGVGALSRVMLFSAGRIVGRGNAERVRKWKRIFAWTVGASTSTVSVHGDSVPAARPTV